MLDRDAGVRFRTTVNVEDIDCGSKGLSARDSTDGRVGARPLPKSQHLASVFRNDGFLSD